MENGKLEFPPSPVAMSGGNGSVSLKGLLSHSYGDGIMEILENGKLEGPPSPVVMVCGNGSVSLKGLLSHSYGDGIMENWINGKLENGIPSFACGYGGR